MAEQLTLFDYIREDFSVENKVRLIELFAGSLATVVKQWHSKT